MRRLLDFLVLLVVAWALWASFSPVPVPVSAQAPVVPSGGDTDQIGVITTSGTANGVVVPLNGYSCLGLDVEGTWSGSLLVQASVDYAALGAANAHWGVTTVVPITSGLSAQAITANGQFQANAGGFSAFRIYAVSLVSGSATLTARRGNGVCTVMADNPFPVNVTFPVTTNVASSALVANQVISSSAGTSLYGFNISADSTLSAAAWWIMLYNATSAPGDGAVTPFRCYAMASGTTSYSAAFPIGLQFPTGITIGVSTTGCFTKTASTHAFISGDFK